MTKVTRAIIGAAVFGLAVIVPVKAGAVSAAEIAALPWNESNLAALRSADRADVEKFVNRALCDGASESDCNPDRNVERFEWVDLEGNGRYALATVWDEGNRAEAVSIYQRNSSGKISEQSIDVEGYAYEDRVNWIRDLNRDGKKELIINRGFGEGPGGMAGIPLAEVPLVYRLQDGQYVEASREFSNFYDKEILPPLEHEIAAFQKKLDSEAEARASGEALMKQYHHAPASTVGVDSHWSPGQAEALNDLWRLSTLQLLRYKILRVSGRDPTAEEEKQAREWMKSPAIELIDDAQQAYQEMGGHEAEVRGAEQVKSRLLGDAKQPLREEPNTAPLRPAVAPGNPIGMRPAQTN